MKPRTKLQKRTWALSKQLKKVSKSQKEWAFQNTLDHKAYRNAKGIVVCLTCAHEWKSEFEQNWHSQILGVKCENCKRKVQVIKTRRRTDYQFSSFTIVTKVKEAQVVRNFYVQASYKKGEKADLSCREISQVFIYPDGKHELIAGIIGMGYNSKYNSDLQIRHRNKVFPHDFCPKYLYPRVSITDQFKRSGFNIDCINSPKIAMPIVGYFKALINPHCETLNKAGRYKMLKNIICGGYGDRFNHESINCYWPSIRQVLKHNYQIKPEAVSIWFDHIKMLEENGYDIRSPKYVCPKDLKRDHQLLIARIQRKNDRIEREKQLALMEEHNKIYFKEKKKYLHLSFSKDDYSFVVLPDVNSFYNDGKLLKHCIYTGNYYKRKDSLIFRCIYKNEIVETLEFNLKEKTISQCRGYDNNPTVHNKKLKELFKGFIKEIKPKKVTKQKQAA